MNFKKTVAYIISIVMICGLFSVRVDAADNILAFPEAEGGGKYAKGARGASSVSVYHVTSLADSGQGTLRDAVSKEGRIIVFDVSGTIELRSQLAIKESNLTILAQTAPGDGVTVSGGDILLADSVKNIIIRYLKVRPTDKNGGEPDGLGGRFNSNVIFDHCSVSWCVDELLTLYAGPAQSATLEKPVGNHLTIQNTIGSESLRMSNHAKGAHGYGGILGGTNASYVSNLFAHHDSRSPRLDRQLQKTEVSENVIFDWGQTNSAYGAEPYSSGGEQKNPSIVNWVNNYYKAGPSTANKIRTRIFDISAPQSDGDPKSQFYFSGNYMDGTGIITNYENSSYVNRYDSAELLENKIDMGEYSIEYTSAQDAYDYVLANAGATLPRRDAIDARIINDVKNGTGRLINNASETGGLIPVKEEHREFKIPDEWLLENGLSGKSETDIIESGEFAGYTVIEGYVNFWTQEESKTPPTNPNIIVQSPAISSLSKSIEGLSADNGEWSVITEGEPLSYKATAIAVGGNAVTKMELYDKNTLISSFDGSEIDTEVFLKAGTHYLTCRAYNTRGEQTQSTTSIVYVKSAEPAGSYSYTEIRDSNYNGYKGKGGASMDGRGVYTVYGSGRITTKSNDSCGFMYKEVDGDFDITVRTEEIPKFENQQVSGLMVRAGLDSNSVMAMIGDGWIKYGENVRVFSRQTAKTSISEQYFKNKNGDVCENTDKVSYAMPKYMRIQRDGNTLTFSVSNSGTDWTDNDRQPMTITYNNLPSTMYVGLATDSASDVSVKEYFSSAKFSQLTLNGESDIEVSYGHVPFYDTYFDNTDIPEWNIPGGSGNRDLSSLGLSGNYGEAMLFWGAVYRTFDPQSDGILSATADFYTTNNPKVNENAGARFMLNGIDENGNPIKIKSIYAQHDLGFFTDYDETNPRPDIAPDSGNKFELEKWYKVEMTLNYYTGKGSFSFKPYTEYNSKSETYITGGSIFDYEFDFDTSIPLCRLHFERRGGYEMYLDNVGLDVYKRTLLRQDGNQIVVDKPECDADLYIASYDESDRFAGASVKRIAQGETRRFDIPSAYSAKVFLWDSSLRPMCDSLDLK